MGGASDQTPPARTSMSAIFGVLAPGAAGRDRPSIGTMTRAVSAWGSGDVDVWNADGVTLACLGGSIVTASVEEDVVLAADVRLDDRDAIRLQLGLTGDQARSLSDA